jgi:hypothetical protein
VEDLRTLIEEMLAERRRDFQEVVRALSADSLLYRSLPSPLHLRELALLINLDRIQDVEDEREVARRLSVVESRLIDMAKVMEAFKDMQETT